MTRSRRERKRLQTKHADAISLDLSIPLKKFCPFFLHIHFNTITFFIITSMILTSPSASC